MGCKAFDKTKKKHKKGLWSPEEDLKLNNYIFKHGHGCWSSVPINAGLQRNGKSCRLRWINYLRPGLKRGTFNVQEEDIILSLHQMLGNKWSQIANHLPGRTDNEIKNYWHSYLKKRVAKMPENGAQVKDEDSSEQTQTSQSSPTSFNAAISQDSGFGSFEYIKGSLMDTDQSMQQMGNAKGAPECKLPKVLFAEWFVLDQFQNSVNGPHFISSLDNNSSNFEEASSHSYLLNEEKYGCELDIKSSSISVDDMLQSSFEFNDQVPESGVVDYFDEFNINYDDMFM